jgi:aspartokinase-like uncharacterized kinase
MTVAVVVKVGGSLLAHERRLDAVLATIARAARHVRLLIVPGGGPFADAVRGLDRRLSDDAAHWMAILGMDQYAHVLADRIAGAVIVTSLADARAALDDGRLPVLAPSSWLRQVDPLPHSWDVTSDSIAAWVAGEVGAHQLVLVKAPGATGELVDRHFARALPASVMPVMVPADRLDDAVFTATARAPQT